MTVERVTTVVEGSYDVHRHRLDVVVDTEGRQIRFAVDDIPDDTYGYARPERELVRTGHPEDRVRLWAQPDGYRWLVGLFARAGVADAEASRVLAAVKAGLGAREFRFVYERAATERMGT